MGLYEFGRRGTIERFIGRQPNPTGTRRELERFYEQTAPVHNVRVDKQFLLIPDNIFLVNDLCWICLNIEPNKLLGITINYLSTLYLYGIDGQCGMTFVGNEKRGRELMEYLYERLPNVYFSEHIHQKDLLPLTERWRQKKDYAWFFYQGRSQHAKK